ncbi:MAG TPA: hypothetical protein DIT34_13550 [Acinetobacter ursingii]|uniref:Phage tail protein C-terminal domain-containing protein n=1 Tax=Acinetobacter ursingii TaxID=108980 RepID=A0A3D2SN68_9GAMM|nr:hypothetical protein [Acinetobacter ursingii]HCO09302.1 hypothetical protein [Acinetobacter ursingii]
MTIQTINIGNSANDGNGEPARSAFNKINQNFTNYSHSASRLVGTQSGNVMEVGAFGLGGVAETLSDKKQKPINRFFKIYEDPAVTNTPDWIQGLEIAWNYQSEGVQFFCAAGGSTLSGIRKYYQGAWSQAYFFRHSGNTIIDGNGFIKAASPVVQLFSDKIELNDEAAEQNITFKKVDIGHYLIQGSSGFALEGWYIETPKDANGNILFAVNYEQLENGDIEVKTYKKKFDFESASIVADLETPVDITLNRWIDIRLQEVPKLVPEIPTEEVNSDEPQQ